MYKEFDETFANPIAQVLALDWDETTTDYPLAFRELAKRFEKIIIVTVNDELDISGVCKCLNRNPKDIRIFCCPDDRIEDVPVWKSEICYQEKAALMFDDNPDVIRACHNRGVNAICVNERKWKFDQII